jgi:DNA polymerase III epsilon subunit family exonuclease
MPGAMPVRVAIDIETTGLQVESDSIIEIGAVRFRGAEILDSFETFVEPRRSLPYRIQRLTHITPAMLVGAPTFGAIAPRLRELLGDAPLVGHSVGFDAAFLRKLHVGERNQLLDTFELASLLLPTLPSYSLDSVAAHLGLSAPNHHRALADAILARDVVVALEARIAAMPDQILIDLCELTSPAVLPSSALLRQERARRGIAGGAAASFGQALGDKLRMHPAVLNLHVAAMPAPAPDLIAPIVPTDALAAAGAPDPAVGAAVTACLDDGALGMVELAPPPDRQADVLLPALAWALTQDRRLCIATAAPAGARTLADALPALLARVTEQPVRVATLLEPRDYLCLHRWYGPARLALAHDADALRGFAKLTVWAHGTATGARDEVMLNPIETSAWETVRASADFVGMAGCAYRERGWCFARRARESAEEARIILTTHAALFDAASALPPADGYLLLDAHLLEEQIMDRAAYGMEVAPLNRALDALWRRDGQGLLAQAVHAIPGDTGQNWGNQATKARDAARIFFAALTALPAEAQAQGKHPANAEGAPQAVRLDESARALPGWGSLAEAWQALEKRLNALSDSANQAQRLLAKVRGTEALAQELAARQSELRQIARWGHDCLDQPRDDMVYWIRAAQPPRPNTRGRYVPSHDESAALHGAPTHAAHLVGPVLRALHAGVVLAGTALAVEGRFDQMADRLGVAPLAQTAAPPLDFRAQTLLLVPADAPEPNMPAYQRSMNDALVQVARALNGNTVALFASHTALRTTYNTIKPILEQDDILVLAQGMDGSLRQMWQNFRGQERIVLLGAGGMWEGWESDGARPGCLFIPRLPLPALGDPAIAARAERHSDHMHHFTVPHAALRLRQALNRLAWAHTNRNVVILYDGRVISKDYGATILNTLPPLILREPDATMLGTTAHDWLHE